MRKVELEIYQQIYIQCHNLFISFAFREGTDEDAKQFMAAADISRKKVHDHPYWFKMLKLTTDEIDKIWKVRRCENNETK